MIATWYSVVCFMLIAYVVLDGRNFGAGMLHWFVARTPEERRQVVAAIGPLWSWHEVWLVGFGGNIGTFSVWISSGEFFLVLLKLVFESFQFLSNQISSTEKEWYLLPFGELLL